MSILVRGMEMPTSCFSCDVERLADCDFYKGAEVEKGKRYERCPLIEIPPHGRLIDADALGIREEEKQAYEAYLREKGEFFIEEPLLEYLRGRSDGLIHASGLVRFAPTIIPAEKGEKSCT